MVVFQIWTKNTVGVQWEYTNLPFSVLTLLIYNLIVVESSDFKIMIMILFLFRTKDRAYWVYKKLFYKRARQKVNKQVSCIDETTSLWQPLSITSFMFFYRIMAFPRKFGEEILHAEATWFARFKRMPFLFYFVCIFWDTLFFIAKELDSSSILKATVGFWETLTSSSPRTWLFLHP